MTVASSSSAVRGHGPDMKNVTRESVVYVIDNDASVRAALKEHFESVALTVNRFVLVNAYANCIRDIPSCLVLEVTVEGITVLKIQYDRLNCKVHVPIIFVTDHGDIQMAVRAMKAGAV